jgi:hypothetical protein
MFEKMAVVREKAENMSVGKRERKSTGSHEKIARILLVRVRRKDRIARRWVGKRSIGSWPREGGGLVGGKQGRVLRK